MRVKLREDLSQAADLLGMLWYHGTFPLSILTYSAIMAFGLGFVVGRYL